MTAILGFADLLGEPGQSEADRLGCVETIRRNGEHLLAIINDILDISRIEAGRMTVEVTDTSAWDVMNEVALLLRPRAEAKGVALEVVLDGPAPARVRSDPLRLRQTLVNLVGNAVKFTDRGSVRLVMRTERTEGSPAAWLCIDVIDSGIGISPEQMSRLFKPFSQGDGSMVRRYGGTGLGLSISAKLAAMLGGEIRASSEPGRGSTFTLRLPVETLEGIDMLTPESAPRPQRPQARTGGVAGYVASSRGGSGAVLSGKVLLAEDGPDNQRLISFMLLRAGAHVEVAENGRVAVDMALAAAKEGSPYGVILMDMQMPEMDGYSATRALREQGYRGPIVALTAHAMADDRTKCLGAGCDEFLTKPVTREGLTAACARWMERTAPV
jgi:CheY-like chemotaxis protein